MKFRKIIFWLHLIAGVGGGSVILVMAVTGVLLAYEKQITSWADGYRIVPPSGRARLPLETLLMKIRETQSNAVPSMITARADPSAPILFSFGREKTMFLNPHTGEFLGEGAKRTRAFFHFVTDVHRWLGAGTENRAVGKSITGACNLAFFFLVISGFYLWWPRNWSLASLRSIVVFNRGLRGKARDWNWHNVIGFWSALPLFFIVLTGVIMSYTWANNLLFRITGNEPPPARPLNPPRAMTPPADLNLGSLNAVWTIAEQKASDWRIMTVRLPTAPDGPLALIVDRGNGVRPDLRNQFTINSKTGEIVGEETYAGYNLGRKLRLWGRWIHTGEAAGIPGQTIAGMASLGGVFLVWTGLSLALRRFFGKSDKGNQSDQIQYAPESIASNPPSEVLSARKL